MDVQTYGQPISLDEAIELIPEREEIGASCKHTEHGVLITELPRDRVVRALRRATGIFRTPTPEDGRPFPYGIYTLPKPGRHLIFIETIHPA